MPERYSRKFYKIIGTCDNFVGRNTVIRKMEERYRQNKKITKVSRVKNIGKCYLLLQKIHTFFILITSSMIIIINDQNM